jgi:16S rRNA (uracil1498-N3)-methyltransferase
MVAHITARIFEEYVRRVRYALAFVPVKGTRNDYVLEKGTELGIAQFFPFVSRYSVIPRLCSSRTKRFRKIAVSAMLQSQQYYLPKIDVFGNVEALTEVFTQFDRVFVAEQKGDKNINEHGSSVLLVVGPEGGFDKEEIGLFERGGVRLLSLGQQRLRSETAAIVGVTKIMSAYGEL